jgi:hypothetical protein
LIGVGDIQAYTGLYAIVYIVINAISRYEDPFSDLIVDLTSIIKSL